MSLIQQALEKSSRDQGARTMTSVPVTKPWEYDFSGGAFEEKSIQAQKKKEKQGSSRRKTAAVMLAWFGIVFVVGISLLGIQRPPLPALPVSPVVATPSVVEKPALQAPIEIVTRDLFRVTGIMSLDGKPMAVINDRIVGEGDSLFDKAVVKQIGSGEVVLDAQGKELKLVL